MKTHITLKHCGAVRCSFGAPEGLRFYSCFRTSKLFLQLPNTPPTGSVSVVLLDCILRGFGVSVATHKSRCKISAVSATV